MSFRTKHTTKGEYPPQGTSGAAAFVIGHNLYVFAGHTEDGNTNDLFKLDLRELRWSYLLSCQDSDSDSDGIDNTPSPRDKLASWTYDNKY